MSETLADLLAWLEPNALLLALALPPVIRVVGHLIPEEVFMVAIGVLAARAPSSGRAGGLLAAVLASHLVTDQLTYLLGRWLRPRLSRWPRVQSRLARVTDTLSRSPVALAGLIPARVLPLGRGAWLAGCGVVGIRWPVFLAVDLVALAAHVAVWCGMGWWLSNDLIRLEASTAGARTVGVWVASAALAVLALTLAWRRLPALVAVTARVARRRGDSLTSGKRSAGDR